jgi:hypothetical protein
MTDTSNIRQFRRRLFGPSKKELHWALVQQKKLETGHHAQLENFLTNHGLLLVQIIQNLGQVAMAINEVRDRIQDSDGGGRSASDRRLDALESMIDSLAQLQQTAERHATDEPPRLRIAALDPKAGDDTLQARSGILKDLREIRSQLGAIAGQSTASQLSGMVANVENALLNVSAMVSELVGGGLASRLEVVQDWLADMRGQMQLQNVHAEGLNTLLDAQNAQVRGLAEDLRTATAAAASGASAELSGKLDNVLNALSNLVAVTNGLAGASQAELVGRLENLSNALLNTGLLVNDLASGGLPGRIERVEQAIAVLGERLGAQVQAAGAGVASEVSGKLDAVLATTSAVASVANKIAGPAQAEILGRLENVSNSLLNVGALTSELAGSELPGRMDRIEQAIGGLGDRLNAQSRHAADLNALLDSRGVQLRGDQEQLRAQLDVGRAGVAELAGKLDNVSNALLNIASMVSGLVGEGTASRLERVEKMQDDLRAKLDHLSQALPAIGAHLEELLTRHDLPARLNRIERAFGEAG